MDPPLNVLDDSANQMTTIAQTVINKSDGEWQDILLHAETLCMFIIFNAVTNNSNCDLRIFISD